MRQMDSGRFKYDAFISYRHIEPDITIAKNVHKLLEGYHIPSNIARKLGKKRFARVFRDQEELPVSEDLSNDIQYALENSQYLVVICSKNTPKSKWCMREVEVFKKIRGSKYIFALLIDGEPNDSFPPVLRFVEENVTDVSGKIAKVSKEIEPLAADIRESSIPKMLKGLKKHEILRIIAPMLGVEYDALRQRHKERFMKQVIAAALMMILFLSVFGSVVLTQYMENIRLAGDNNQLNANMDRARKEISSSKIELDRKKKEVSEATRDLEQKRRDLASANDSVAQKQREIDKAVLELDNKIKALKTANDNIRQKQARLNQLARANEQKQQELDQTINDIKEQKLFASMNFAETAINKGNRMKASAIVMTALKAFGTSSRRYHEFATEAERILSMSTYVPKYESYAVLKNQDQVNDCAFSPDDRFFTTVSKDKKASVWNAQNGEKSKEFIHASEVTAVCFGENSDTLFTATLNGQICMWNVKSGKQIKNLPDFGKLTGYGKLNIYRLFLNPCDKNLYILGYSTINNVNRIVMARWDTRTDSIKKIGENLSAAEFSEDGKLIVMASWNGEIACLDASKAKMIVKALPKDYTAGRITISHDNRCFFTSPRIPGDLIFWNPGNLDMLRKIQMDTSIYDMSVSPDNKFVGVCLYDGDGFICDTSTGQKVANFNTNGMPVNRIIFLNNQYFLTSATFSGKLLDVWKLETLYGSNKQVTRQAVHVTAIQPPDMEIVDLRLSNHKKILTAASVDGTTKLYSLQQAFNYKRVNRKMDDICQNGSYFTEQIITDVSGKRQLVTNVDDRERIVLRDAATKKDLKTYRYSGKSIHIDSVSADFKYALITDQKNRHYIMQPESGRILSEARIPIDYADAALNCSGDGAVVMTANLKAIWVNLKTGETEKEVKLDIDVGKIYSWEISADFDENRLVAIGTYPRGSENIAYVFQLSTGKKLYEIRDAEIWDNYITTIDGKCIMTKDLDTTLSWTFSNYKNIVREAERQLNGRTLTREERKECNLDF